MQSNRALLLRRTDKTLRISIPREFCIRRGLSEGDHVMWIEEEDGVKLKFVRAAELEEIAAASAA
jgi:hypothetical protein